MTRAVLSLGANLGDRERTLADAVARLAPTAASPLYETPPWGDADQPAYYNLVVIADDSRRGPRDWLALAHRLEAAAGRVRDPERRFGPRTLDVDVITVDDDHGPVLLDDPDLELPHPRAHLRAFVLVPWLAADPGAVLPGHGPVRDLLTADTLAADARALRPLHPISSEHHE